MGLAAAWAFFALLAGPHFRSLDNQRLMLLQSHRDRAPPPSALPSSSPPAALTFPLALPLHWRPWSSRLLLNVGAPLLLSALGGLATGLLCGGAIGAMVVGHVGRVAALALGAALAWWAVPHWGWPGGLGAGALAAALVLVLNELTIKRLPLPPFIVTLGMLGALRGLAKGINYVYPPNLGWLPSLMSTTETGFGSILPP